MNMMLKSTTAVALVGYSAAPADAVSTNHPDAELIAMARQAISIGRQADEIGNRVGDLAQDYHARKPTRPDALRWHPTDPVGYEMEQTAPGRGHCWCNSEQIEERRNTPCTREEFVGIQEDWETLPFDAPPSPEQRERFYAQVPNERDQKRFDQILAAHDAYNAELDALRHEIGLDVAEVRFDQLSEQSLDLEREVIGRQAKTLNGLRAKAEMLIYNWGDNLPSGPDDGLVENVMASIVTDLCNFTGVRAVAPDIADAAVMIRDGRLETDPIFVAIDAHRRAWADFSAVCSELSNRVPADKQADAEVTRLNEAIDDAAGKLLDVIPTTIAGASALLAYAAEHASGGNMWPDGYVDEDTKSGWDRVHGVSWEVLLHKNLAKALPNIAA